MIRVSRLGRLFVLLASVTLMAPGPVFPASNSHSKTFRFFSAQGIPADSSVVKGSSAKLTRGDSVVWIRVNTTDLLPGAYTNWWIIFNNPAACTDGCDSTDFGNPAVMASVFWATGGIVGQNGVGHFQAHLEEGVLPSGPGQVAFGPGLLDAQSAEIHYVLKYHGPASSDPAILQKQVTTIYGGCIGGPGQGPDPVVGHQIFPCYDPQATMLPGP